MSVAYIPNDFPAPVDEETAVQIDRLTVVFGPRPRRALPLLDAGASRIQLREATGLTLGVHDCSLTIRRGEILVLMGLSGSGKSTLLRSINGLAPALRGEVRIRDGEGMTPVSATDPAALRRLRLKRVTMVFQHFGLLPWRSVAENVGLGLELAGLKPAERRERVATQLDLVGLSPLAERRVGELSGGQQQRVGLARAIATEAPILLMDEPFSALDPLIRSRLQDELLELQARLKRTIVFVSHDLDEAFKIGDRIALLEEGRLVQCGSAREILSAPATPHVAQFVAHANPLEALTARDAMRPGETASDGSLGSGRFADPDATLGRVIPLFGGGVDHVEVREHGRSIGVIRAEDVLAVLAGRGS